MLDAVEFFANPLRSRGRLNSLGQAATHGRYPVTSMQSHNITHIPFCDRSGEIVHMCNDAIVQVCICAKVQLCHYEIPFLHLCNVVLLPNCGRFIDQA